LRLAEAIVRLLDDRHLARRLGQAAAARAASQFGMDRFVDRVLGLYAEDGATLAALRGAETP
jgi:hypothetical protein